MKKLIFVLLVCSFFIVSCMPEKVMVQESTVEKLPEPLPVKEEIIKEENMSATEKNIENQKIAEKNKTENKTQPVTEPKPLMKKPSLINGKTVKQRLEEAYDSLHTPGSAENIRRYFPDIKLTY